VEESIPGNEDFCSPFVEDCGSPLLEEIVSSAALVNLWYALVAAGNIGAPIAYFFFGYQREFTIDVANEPDIVPYFTWATASAVIWLPLFLIWPGTYFGWQWTLDAFFIWINLFSSWESWILYAGAAFAWVQPYSVGKYGLLTKDAFLYYMIGFFAIIAGDVVFQFIMFESATIWYMIESMKILETEQEEAPAKGEGDSDPEMVDINFG